jgi:thymidylate synthase (FAD)
MKLIKPSHVIERPSTFDDALAVIEQAGKTCYKKQRQWATTEDRENFVKKLIKSGHHSVLEHASMTVRFICDRGVSHELVRHRLAAISQESTRYCDYNGAMEFVIPPWVDIKPGGYEEVVNGKRAERTSLMLLLQAPDDVVWFTAVEKACSDYTRLENLGWTPQQARTILPHSVKTEVVITANLREWRHILSLRAVGTSGTPHPQMVELMRPLLNELKERAPAFFGDI